MQQRNDLLYVLEKKLSMTWNVFKEMQLRSRSNDDLQSRSKRDDGYMDQCIITGNVEKQTS